MTSTDIIIAAAWVLIAFGLDVGYHARAPQYEGQTSMKCDLLGGECFYDGSSLRADEWAKDIFSIRGRPPEEEIWDRLLSEYEREFGNDPTP